MIPLGVCVGPRDLKAKLATDEDDENYGLQTTDLSDLSEQEGFPNVCGRFVEAGKESTGDILLHWMVNEEGMYVHEMLTPVPAFPVVTILLNMSKTESSSARSAGFSLV